MEHASGTGAGSPNSCELVVSVEALTAFNAPCFTVDFSVVVAASDLKY